MKTIALLLIPAALLAGDPKPPSDADKVRILEAQLAVERAQRQHIDLTVQALNATLSTLLQASQQNVQAAQRDLDSLVESLKPKDCSDCQLTEDLNWQVPNEEDER